MLALLDGMAQRNHALVREQLFPGGIATLIRDGQPLQLHFDAFIERLATTGTVKMEELIHDPIIHIDDDIAVIRAPYTFLYEKRPRLASRTWGTRRRKSSLLDFHPLGGPQGPRSLG